MKNLYQILGVKQTANFKTIKKAYRKLVLKYHPDRNQDKNKKKAQQKFKKITKAYKILSSKKKRKKYDQKLKNKNDFKEHRTKKRRKDVDFDQYETRFKDFFGFDPKTKEKVKKKQQQEKEGFSTDSLFNSFFCSNKKSK